METMIGIGDNPTPINSFQTDPEIQKIRDGVNKEYEVRSAPNSSRALQEAREDNLDVVFPADDELQIDIDDDRAYSIYTELFPIVDKYYTVLEVKDRPSRSGLPKRHLTLKLGRKITNYERIALQLSLGSDRVRELLGVVQEMLGDPHPTLFLEKKPEPTPIEEQEVVPLEVPLY